MTLSQHRPARIKSSIKATLQSIRSRGLTATYITAFGEYRVNYPVHDKRYSGSESAYHTTDSQDAIDTAALMAKWSACQ